MRGLAGALLPHNSAPIAAALGRRRVLAMLCAATAATSGCTGPADPSVGATGDVYVALGKARAIAVLDPATDKEVGRISLESLGKQSHPWRLGISPTGGAAVMPLTGLPSIGLVSAGEKPRTGGTARPAARGGGRRCEWVRVDSGRPAAQTGPTPEIVQGMTADAVGRAYVLVTDSAGSGPSYAAIVDLETGAVLRRLPLAAAGESVLALQAAREGTRLYASVWRWDDDTAGPGLTEGVGRVVAVDTGDGRTVAQMTLPANAAATDLALAASPGGSSGAVYASIATPGPSRDENETWYRSPRRYDLAAVDHGRLSTLAVWRLPQRPNAMAVTPDGARAYILSGSWSGSPWSMRLTSVDLATGAPTAEWPLPPSCASLAMAPVGKLYVADVLGDRLWRVDTLRDAFLGSVSQPGAPMAVAARQ